jgi:hypothetical protein
MNLLVDPEVVLSRLALQNLPEVIAALESAISASQLHLEGVIGSPLGTANGIVDYFAPDNDFFGAQVSERFRLGLTNVFVDVNSLEITTSYDRDNIDAGLVVPTSDYSVDGTRGIALLSRRYSGQFVKVEYNAGLKAGVNVPDWLAEAIITYCPVVMNQQQITNRSAEQDSVMRTSALMAYDMVITKFRPKPHVFQPLE